LDELPLEDVAVLPILVDENYDDPVLRQPRGIASKAATRFPKKVILSRVSVNHPGHPLIQDLRE
jgi:hypothetical protein